MRSYESLDRDVVRRGLCLLCGSCAGSCPARVIRMSPQGPVLSGACTACGRCIEVCPGKGLDLREWSRRLFGSAGDGELGHYRKIFCAHSADPALRGGGSSGGVVTTLLTHLLRERLADAAVAVTRSDANPLRSEARIFRSEAELSAAAGSRYARVPVNELAGRLGDFSKVAFVALPCQVHGLRKMEALDGTLRGKIACMIGLFCGFNLSDEGTSFLVRKLGFREEEVTDLSYRHGPSPGSFRVRDRAGREALVDKHSYTLLNLFHSPWRCNLCGDFTAELADLSVGDCWERSGPEGAWARVIVRSERGERILDGAEGKGLLTVVADNAENIRRTQGGLISYKKNQLSARADLLGLLGMRVRQGVASRGGIAIRVKSVLSLACVALCHTPPARWALAAMPLGLMQRFSRGLRRRVHSGAGRAGAGS